MDRDNHVRAYMCEMIGTFVLVFLSAGAVCSVQLYDSASSFASLLNIAVAAGFGLGVGLVIAGIEPRGYLNPAVTMMLWGLGKLDAGKALSLMGVQFVGAAAAGGMIRFVLGNNQLALAFSHMGTPHVQPAIFGAAGVNGKVILLGILTELTLTFLLIMVVYVTLMKPAKKPHTTKARLAPFWVGLTMTLITLAGYQLTGGAANPARWFGAVVWESTITPLRMQNPYSDWLVFIIGPLAASIIGQYVINVLDKESAHHHHEHATSEKSAVGASN